MAISDTITSITNHLTADYEGLENIGADLTGIDKNIQNIRPVLDTIYTSLPKVTDEGTEVTLTPTKKGKLSLVEKGNSEQKSTTGSQLWKPYNLTKNNVSGINWVTSIDGTISASGTATANSLSASSTELASDFISLSAGTYTISGGTTDIRADVIDSTGTRIKMTSGSDTFTLTETKLVQVRALVPTGTTISTPKTIKPMLNSGSTALEWEQYTGGIPAPNPSFPFPIKNVTGNNNVVVKNSDNTESQTLPLNLGTIELNKIGEYQDYIYKNNGKWYKHEVIGKAVLNGTEEWRYQTGNPNFFFLSKGTYDQQNAGVCMSNQYQSKPVSSGNNAIALGNAYFVLIRDDRYTDVSSYKSWLSSNTLIVYYQLGTPTDIEITDTNLINQLEEIDKMKSYNGTTIITSTYDNSNAQMILSASALKGEE